MKTCSRCKAQKPLDDFHRNRSMKDGRQTYCKACASASRLAAFKAREFTEPPSEKFCNGCQQTRPRAEWAANRRHPTGLAHFCKPCTRAKARTKLYGLAPEVYERMVVEQDGRCACCGDRTKLVVDHCHDTGRVRGLLCNACNSAEGYVRTVERAWMLIQYMQARCS